MPLFWENFHPMKTKVKKMHEKEIDEATPDELINARKQLKGGDGYNVPPWI